MIEIGLDPGNRTGGIKSPIRAYQGLSEQLYLGQYSHEDPRTTPTIQHQPERYVQARPPSIILARFQTRGPIHRRNPAISYPPRSASRMFSLSFVLTRIGSFTAGIISTWHLARRVRFPGSFSDARLA